MHGFGLRARNFTVFAETTDDVFGINVFKVREVMPVPKISRPPEAGEAIEGMVSLWGRWFLSFTYLDTATETRESRHRRDAVQEWLAGCFEINAGCHAFVVIDEPGLGDIGGRRRLRSEV